MCVRGTKKKMVCTCLEHKVGEVCKFLVLGILEMSENSASRDMLVLVRPNSFCQRSLALKSLAHPSFG